MRISWTKEEAALLVDAFYRVECGEQSISVAIEETSQRLRRMAINKGIQIDATYRNVNGINMQMRFVKQVAAKAKSGLRHGSKLLSSMVELRANDRKTFDGILDSALRDLLAGSTTNQETNLMFDSILHEPLDNYDTDGTMQSMHATSRKSFSARAGIHAPKNEVNSLLESIRGLLAESFLNGIHPDSILDRKKLKRSYAAKFGEDLPDDLNLPAILEEAGIIHGNKVYVLSDAKKERLRSTIQHLFDQGNHVIYYSELLIHQTALLAECHLYEIPLIRTVLAALLPEAICDATCMQAYKGASSTEDIACVFGKDIALDYSQIKERCPYLSMEAIKRALSTSDRFVWMANETFAQTDLIQLAQGEVDQVQTMILPRMREEGFISLNWLPLQESCDLNPDVSFSAVRDAMYIRYMASECDRKGLIATPKGKMGSTLQHMTAYCRKVDYTTMDELNEYERALTCRPAALILKVACCHMVRVDHDHFVCDTSIYFDVASVDRAIGLFVNDRIVPITAITSFTSFPEVDGYEWNLYLVESFLRRFSRLFSIDGGPAQSSYVGGICPKRMRFKSYEDRLAAAVIQDAVPLNVEAIGKYLAGKKYILRRSTMIKTIFEKALRIKEQRGTTDV